MTNSTEDVILRFAPRIASFCSKPIADMIHQNVFLAALNIFLLITAVLGNLLILVALHNETSLHPPSKLLFRCLASTDLCVGLISQPLYVTYYLALISNHWNACYFRFVLTSSLSTMFCGVSLLTLTAISVDRLLALLLRLRYRQIVTIRRVRIVVVTIWLGCISFTAMLVSFPYITPQTMSTIVLLCIVASSGCYAKVYLKLRHHRTQVDVHVIQPNGQPGNLQNILRYKQTVSTALLLQMSLLVCYLPYYIVTVLTNIAFGKSAVTPLSTNVAFRWATSLTLVFLNSSLNPILYCWKIKAVRQAVKETIREFCSCIFNN